MIHQAGGNRDRPVRAAQEGDRFFPGCGDNRLRTGSIGRRGSSGPGACRDDIKTGREPLSRSINILLTCGETSGEYHAGKLISAIKERSPGSRVIALGGELLEELGAEVSFPMERYSFMGFSEIISGIPRIISLENELKSLMKSGGIDLFIPVDYPGLNLRLAGYASRQNIPVMYFISPQIWAWGGWRIRRMRKFIDQMVVILPFEEKLYRDAGIPVFFANHPVLNEIKSPEKPKEAPDQGSSFRILLFPGSRKQEVGRMLPPMLDAARILRKKFGGAEFILGVAPLIGIEGVEVPDDLRDIVRVTGKGLEELQNVSLVLASSGTVTLQTAVSGTPLVAMYRTSFMSYLLARLMIRIPYVAMPNVLAGEKVIPELIQKEVTGPRIADEAQRILTSRNEYRSISSSLLALREKLRGGGGIERVAELALEMPFKKSI
ncbi:MAG: lipid-A-disaccharide synthase [Candidatus Latescibacteria bacterium]|nr:lipid-A-disaccharide synthase [bacterium]MBD3423396.1 lipid-A-disaccharide synthase [Candidatus Latescibacterota bacterium]